MQINMAALEIMRRLPKICEDCQLVNYLRFQLQIDDQRALEPVGTVVGPDIDRPRKKPLVSDVTSGFRMATLVEELMNKVVESMYQPTEFARIANVTIRTLHHYDRIGLLKPSGYTSAGYRLYRKHDLVRLQQIVTLKFIGFSLTQIKQLLDSNSFDLRAALKQQREILSEKRQQLDLAVTAIEKAGALLESNNEPDWQAFKRIIEVINMQNNMDWTKKYYSEEAKKKIAERAQTFPPEVIEKAQNDWATLIAEVEKAVAEGVSPTSERAAALAIRWRELIRGFTGGDSEIQAGLNKMYSDQGNWPKDFPKPYSDEAGALMCEAMAALQK
jgi:MerR family transcriptional regulator, thiopeptide resistance regulator